MKILQIGTQDIKGGAASISWIIKNEMEKLGHTMPMFVHEKDSHEDDVHVIPRTLHRYIQYALSNDIDFSRTDWIMQTKEFKEADVIHVHNIHGWFFNLKTLQKMAHLKPVVWTLHDMWAITPHCAHAYDCPVVDGLYQCPSIREYPQMLWNNSAYLAWKKKKIYKRLSVHLVTPSKWLGEKVGLSVLNDKPIDLIYNGIDETIFAPQEKTACRTELGLPADKKIVMFLSDGGKRNPYKGWEYLQKIIESRKDILFLCIGGKETGSDKTHPHVTYIPQISDKKILASYFAAADVFLYPTLADNCPLVILEAMACGVPIVTFNTGGVPELVEHRIHGYVAEYKNAEDLSNGLDYVLHMNTQDTEKMSAASRTKILKQFTTSHMVAQYIKLYERIINN